MTYSYSLETYCASQEAPDWNLLPESSRHFLEKLALSAIHPFCKNQSALHAITTTDVPIPPMGPLQTFDQNLCETVVTYMYMTLPPFLAFADCWFRLLSGFVAPLGLLYLLWQEQKDSQLRQEQKDLEPVKADRCTSGIILFTTICSLPVMTDSMYVCEFGPSYGVTLFLASVALGLKACQRQRLRVTGGLVLLLAMLAVSLTWNWETREFQFGEPNDVNIEIEPGLYYSAANALVNRTASLWSEQRYSYTKQTGATNWMYTGDARTGLPFFFNRVPKTKFTRVFLPVQEGEVLALDLSFPASGHDPTRPIYMVLHGINGGSKEDYVRDLVFRRTKENSTVVVMVSRGLMDTPLQGLEMFHGARWSDAHEAAQALRRAMDPGQFLAGVGYSMGAIILNNYVASSGKECALDAAFSISGALECRNEQNYTRPQHLWQPMIVEHIRIDQHKNKWGERMRAKLNHSDLVGLLRATNVVAYDQFIAVAYSQEFDNLTHFYSEMGALGDISVEDLRRSPAEVPNAKIHNVAIPLCVLHAYDDPISTWRTVAANDGFMRPDNLVESGTGNLLLLLTRTGGHVGWPLGWLSFRRNWEFMNEAAATFVEAVSRAKAELV
jgi:predicted alpha/beta-fold hydrolase